MSDRIFAGIVLTVSMLMMWAATLIEESFIQDPLGPKAFPLVIAGVMAISAVVMFFKPDSEPEWPGLYKLLELVATVGVEDLVIVIALVVLPLVLATGAGAEMRQAMGIAVFAGMLGVTLFGLFLTPVFYVVMRGLAARFERPRSRAKLLMEESTS